jgi:hypothetical protein
MSQGEGIVAERLRSKDHEQAEEVGREVVMV